MVKKPSASSYDILESKYGSRSADLIQWWTENEDSVTDLKIYMEEEFSAIRFVSVLVLLLIIVGLGGSLYISKTSSEPSNKSWLSLTTILLSVILFGLSPVLFRKL